MRMFSNGYGMFQEICTYGYLKTGSALASFGRRYANSLLVLLGLLILSYSSLEFAQAQNDPVNTEVVQCSNGLLLWLVEGSFGSLLLVVAGLGMLIGAAVGAYRTAWSCLVVIIGAFTLRSWVHMFFGWGTGNGIIMDPDACADVMGFNQGLPGAGP